MFIFKVFTSRYSKRQFMVLLVAENKHCLEEIEKGIHITISNNACYGERKIRLFRETFQKTEKQHAVEEGSYFLIIIFNYSTIII